MRIAQPPFQVTLREKDLREQGMEDTLVNKIPIIISPSTDPSCRTHVVNCLLSA